MGGSDSKVDAVDKEKEGGDDKKKDYGKKYSFPF